jgi:hypothetical protein
MVPDVSFVDKTSYEPSLIGGFPPVKSVSRSSDHPSSVQDGSFKAAHQEGLDIDDTGSKTHTPTSAGDWTRFKVANQPPSVKSPLMDKVRRRFCEFGAESLTEAYLAALAAGHAKWTRSDFLMLSLLIILPGGSILVPVGLSVCNKFGYLLPDDWFAEPWLECTTPSLSVPLDEVEGCVAEAEAVFVCDPVVIPQAKSDQQGWEEKGSRFVAQTLLSERKLAVLCPETSKPLYRATADSFRFLTYLDPLAAALGSQINSIARIPTTNFTGKLIGDPTASAVNARGNFKSAQHVRRFGVGTNLHFDTADPFQHYLALAKRYCVPRKSYVIDGEGKALAKRIADHTFEMLVDPERCVRSWNDVRDGTVYKGWLKKARESGYASSHDLLTEESDRIVRFHGKSMVKVKQDLSFDGVFKAPQGISAWSKGANSFFGAACRIIGEVINDSLKEEVVWNNQKTEEEAVKRFMKAAMKLPSFNGVTLDATEMDSMQNHFTHAIVYFFIQRFGVDEDFLSLYFSMVVNYTLVSDIVVAHLEHVKCSGEPWTGLGNWSLSMCMQCWLFEGDGPIAIFGQGDDARRNQANLRINQDKVEQLKLFCGFEMSVIFSEYGDLCGFIFSHGLVVPSIRRKLSKLIGADFLSMQHFYDYQISLREWADRVKFSPAYEDIMRINAENNGVNEHTVETWFETIESVGHLTWEQFTSESTAVKKQFSYVNGSGHLDVV